MSTRHEVLAYMSEASFAELQEHWVLLTRRLQRRVSKAAAAAGNSSASPSLTEE
jgi:hypothetical protein